MDNEKEQLADAAAAEQSADTAAASGGSGVDMKLDFKRTLFVGFAFMGIMCFWEVYDYIMPLILQRVFGMEYAEYGIIMGLDNLLAIFLLPLFGHLSDRRSKAKFGRRTTFIFWGTILAVVFMICMAVIEHVQYGLLTKVGDLDDPQVVYDYMTQYGGNWSGDAKESIEAFIAGWQNADYQTWFKGLADGSIELTAEQNALYNSEFLTPFYAAQQLIAAQVRGENIGLLVMFIFMLLATLVAMASYRSPAIALMPDVTPKPLRSQANALITFMGGAGGFVSILIYTVYNMVSPGRYQSSHIWIFVVLGVLMLVMLGAFLAVVREKKFVQMRYDEEKRWNVVDEEEVHANEPLGKEKRLSFFLILGTVFLWFLGWNAIKSHLSTYATGVLKFEDSFVSVINILNGAGGAIALLPVALLAAKFGRKKTILMGVVIAVCAFVPCIFLNDGINATLLKVAFTACFLIAGFGLVIINVNTLPMVTELAKGSNVGQYTGYYYVASMTAQAVTPYLSGLIMDANPGKENLIFVYGVCCIAMAFVTMFFTKHGDNRPEKKKKTIEYFADED